MKIAYILYITLPLTSFEYLHKIVAMEAPLAISVPMETTSTADNLARLSTEACFAEGVKFGYLFAGMLEAKVGHNFALTTEMLTTNVGALKSKLEAAARDRANPYRREAFSKLKEFHRGTLSSLDSFIATRQKGLLIVEEAVLERVYDCQKELLQIALAAQDFSAIDGEMEKEISKKHFTPEFLHWVMRYKNSESFNLTSQEKEASNVAGFLHGRKILEHLDQAVCMDRAANKAYEDEMNKAEEILDPELKATALKEQDKKSIQRKSENEDRLMRAFHSLTDSHIADCVSVFTKEPVHSQIYKKAWARHQEFHKGALGWLTEKPQGVERQLGINRFIWQSIDSLIHQFTTAPSEEITEMIRSFYTSSFIMATVVPNSQNHIEAARRTFLVDMMMHEHAL